MTFKLGDWMVEPALNRLRRGDSEHQLEPKAMDLLAVLLARPGEVVATDELLRAVWPDRVVEPNAVQQRVHRIRAVLGDDPRNPTFIENIPRRGYRVIAPVARLQASPPQPVASGRDFAERQPSRWRAGNVVVGAVVLLAAAAVSWWQTAVEPPVAAGGETVGESAAGAARAVRAIDTPKLAVLPFGTLNEVAQEVPLALTLDANSQLSKLNGLIVMSSLAVQAAVNRGVDPAGMGAELDVDYVLAGSIRSTGDEALRLDVELSRVADGASLWTGTYRQPLQADFELETRLARDVAAVLEIVIGPEVNDLLERAAHRDFTAFRLLARAKELSAGLNAPDFRKRTKALVVAALELDPEYVDAVAHLAWLHVWDVRNGHAEQLPVARQYAQRALELNAQAATAHFAMGSVLTAERRFGAAVKSFRRAAAIDYSIEHLLRDLSAFLLFTGQHAESLEVALRAVEIDPGNGITLWHLAGPLAAVDFDRAVALVEAAVIGQDGVVEFIRLNNLLILWDAYRGEDVGDRAAYRIDKATGVGWPEGRADNAFPAWLAGRNELAAAQFIELAQTNPLRRVHGGPHLPVYALYFRAGRGEDVEAALGREIKRHRQRLDGGVETAGSPISLAALYVLSGDLDTAIEWLDRAVFEYRYFYFERIQHDPLFRPLQNHPRWPALAQGALDQRQNLFRIAQREGLIARVDVLLESFDRPDPGRRHISER